MDHATAEALMPAYFASTLERATVRELNIHMKACERCRLMITAEGSFRRARVQAEKRAAELRPLDQALLSRNRQWLWRVLALMGLGLWVVWRLGR